MTGAKALFDLAAADDAPGLMAALPKGAESFSILNENGETLYLFSLYRGRIKCAEALAKRGRLSLHEAAAAGDAARVEECLKSAPWAINTLSADGWTALHLAAFLGRDAAVLRLLALGASPHQWARAFDQNLAVHAAASGGRIGKEAFAKLVAATGDANIASKQGATALMSAANNGSAPLVDELLAAGADPKIKMPDGKTAADFALARGHAELAKRLGA
jgi:ankyrin repeat protein